MLKQLKKRKEGFTIIEVLIVLAIAGLIMLIVFMAVPALQRNSRNTQRRNDVSKVLGLMQESVSNNAGSIPTTAPTNITADKYSFYDLSGANLNYNIVASGTAATLQANIDSNTIVIRNNLKCNSSGATAFAATSTASPAGLSIGNATTNVATSTGATTRTIVSIYAVEGSGGNV